MKLPQLVVPVLILGICHSVPLKRLKRWSVRTTMTVPAPDLPPKDLADVLATAPHIRYSDWDMGLTAVKSSQHNACFIFDLDPGFFLFDEDIQTILHQQAPEVIDSPPAYNHFRQRAGPLITPMCQHTNIYWLNNDATPPLPLTQDPPTDLPEPIRPNVVRTPSPIGNGSHNTPPPPNAYHQSQQSKKPQTALPLEQYHQQQEQANQSSPPAGHVILTPPPLNIWRQQRAEK